MKDSGYSEQVRMEIIKGGVIGYEKQVEIDRSGECPLYRPREYRSEERRVDRGVDGRKSNDDTQ